MATTGAEVLKLEAQVEARLGEEQRRAARRIRWIARATSLWSPAALFGALFLPYVTMIEFDRATASWGQGAMKAVGLFSLAWWAALLVLRLAAPRASMLRELRRQAGELESEIYALLRRHAAQVDARVREELLSQVVEVRAASVAGERAALEKQLARLGILAEKHLARWRRQSALDVAIGFAKMLAIALLIRTVVVEPFKIPSGSMIPTLAVGDQVFVNKFIYGVRIPFMNKVPFVIVRPPRAGDVIVFNNPSNESVDYIKRVVGVPGDTVEIFDEVISINGQVQPRKLVSPDEEFYNQTQDSSATWFPEHSSRYEESLGGVEHATLEFLDHPRGGKHEGPFVVPAGHVFVMGDNRDNSTDSRYGLGNESRAPAYVPYGNIKGKAMVIWLSLSYDGLLSRVFGGTGLRTDRFFLPVR